MNPKPQPRLVIELVPATCWCSNLRSELRPKDWDILRKAAYASTNFHCEVCACKPKKLDAHEVWQYDDKNLIQTLVRLQPLCARCHEVKHIGLAEVRGNMSRAVHWLSRVNEWTYPVAMRYVTAQFEIWSHRSKFQWTLDVNYLQGLGIELKKRA
jgi:hypothetical protein